MKRIFVLLIISTSTLLNAQLLNLKGVSVNFGVKANYLERASRSKWTFESDAGMSAKEGIGFNVGVFSKIKLPIPVVPLFVMPEVYFTSYKTKATYTRTILDKTDRVDLKANNYRLDIPILIGYDLAGILEVFAGPVISNHITGLGKSSVSELKSVAAGTMGHFEEEITSDKLSVGFQAGIQKTFLSNLIISAKFEIANKEHTRKFVGKYQPNEINYIDKPNFLMIGVGYQF